MPCGHRSGTCGRATSPRTGADRPRANPPPSRWDPAGLRAGVSTAADLGSARAVRTIRYVRHRRPGGQGMPTSRSNCPDPRLARCRAERRVRRAVGRCDTADWSDGGRPGVVRRPTGPGAAHHQRGPVRARCPTRPATICPMTSANSRYARFAVRAVVLGRRPGGLDARAPDRRPGAGGRHRLAARAVPAPARTESRSTPQGRRCRGGRERIPPAPIPPAGLAATAKPYRLVRFASKLSNAISVNNCGLGNRATAWPRRRRPRLRQRICR